MQWKLVENRLKKLEEIVIEEAQERIELKVDQLKRNMDEPMVQVVQGALEGVLQQDKEEEMEIARRKKNVIVHGVSEPQATDADQRVEEDLTVLAAMFHEVGVDELKVESVARLGKRNEDAEHPRPMKVVLDCEEGKVKLLRNAKKLEDKTGRRLDEGVYPSGSNTKAKGGKKTTCSGVETTQSQWGKRFDHLQRNSGTKESAPISRDNLKCFYINARSIINKIDQFEAWVYELNPDIVGVTESWTGSHILDSELAINGYDLFRQDRLVDRAGGGVLLYVRSILCPVQCELLSKFPEQVWCYIPDSKGHRFYIGVCYRSPTVNIYGNGNHELLRDVINELGLSKRHFVMMGDYKLQISRMATHVG